MLTDKIKKYLIENKYYDTTEDLDYQKALESLGININSSFAQFNLGTNAMTFKGRIGNIYNVCWFYINSSYEKQIIAFQENFSIPKEYIPLDSFEGEGGFFYNRKTGEVIELELGEKLLNFQKGIIDTKWDSFNEFLEWYFELN
ncbi:hypothetical protein KLA_15605 [Cellulophaga geojensis KL-A]|uniref:Knr4/Smi1-like domain-containing protein n=1 Tax=Cellulophaga geojensis KL-A TaxID=1328323 RepID=A0ABP3B312_9FLAO|nr:hypothetical protein [Cellulophaga geojensis]EWH11436.1 hypothetical protein KLA_15605 [Cellulophaga geojensis KL-A]